MDDATESCEKSFKQRRMPIWRNATSVIKEMNVQVMRLRLRLSRARKSLLEPFVIINKTVRISSATAMLSVPVMFSTKSTAA